MWVALIVLLTMAPLSLQFHCSSVPGISYASLFVRMYTSRGAASGNELLNQNTTLTLLSHESRYCNDHIRLQQKAQEKVNLYKAGPTRVKICSQNTLVTLKAAYYYYYYCYYYYYYYYYYCSYTGI